MVDGGERRLVAEAFADVDEHLPSLKREFVGLPELCFAHARLIVLIRRKIDLDSNLSKFFGLWQREASFLGEHLSSRRLILACDTFADYGTERQQAAAVLLVVLINTLKLAETERLAIVNNVPDRLVFETIASNYERGEPWELWDGMPAYSPFIGGMPRNMFGRLSKITDKDPAFRQIARAHAESHRGGYDARRIRKAQSAFCAGKVQGAERRASDRPRVTGRRICRLWRDRVRFVAGSGMNR